MNVLFAILFCVLIGLALGLFLASRKQRAQTGLPFNARIVYSDTGAWSRVEKPLFSREYALTGKPDYIVKENGATIPIEVKPNRTAPTPRASDVMQLAAYGLLIEEAYGAHPPHGLLKYRDAVFQIDFTDELQSRLLGLMKVMRQDFRGRDVERNHTEPARCRACGYRAECGQAVSME